MRFACLARPLSLSCSLPLNLAYSISTLALALSLCHLFSVPASSSPTTCSSSSSGMPWQCAYVCFLPSCSRLSVSGSAFLTSICSPPFSLHPLSLSLSLPRSLRLSCCRLHSFACGCRFLLLQICCSSNGNLLLTTAAAAMQTSSSSSSISSRMCSYTHTHTCVSKSGSSIVSSLRAK